MYLVGKGGIVTVTRTQAARQQHMPVILLTCHLRPGKDRIRVDSRRGRTVRRPPPGEAGKGPYPKCQEPEVVFATGMKPLGGDTFLVVYGAEPLGC